MAVEGIQGTGTVLSPGNVGKWKPSSPPAAGSGKPVPVGDVVTLSGAGKMPKLRSCELRWDVRENPDRVVVKVLDSNTGEEIRQIPPEEILRVAAQLQLLMSR